MQIERQSTPLMNQYLPSLLFPEYRRRVLGLLLLRPDEALHGREIARRTGLPAGTITRELTKLAESGLLKRTKRDNQQVYSADTACPIFAELAFREAVELLHPCQATLGREVNPKLFSAVNSLTRLRPSPP